MLENAHAQAAPRALRVLVAENHRLVSQGLELLISTTANLEFVGVVTSGEQAVARAKSENVDVVLTATNLGRRSMDGFEVTRKIKEGNPDTKVLVLSMFTDPGTVAEAIKAGADGYLSKAASREAVLRAIREVAEGRSVLDPNVSEGIFFRFDARAPHVLIDEELEILRKLSRGESPWDGHERIGAFEKSVKSYFRRIIHNLGLDARIQWNGFRDPRDSIFVLVCLAVFFVLLAWSLWRFGGFGP